MIQRFVMMSACVLLIISSACSLPSPDNEEPFVEPPPGEGEPFHEEGEPHPEEPFHGEEHPEDPDMNHEPPPPPHEEECLPESGCAGPQPGDPNQGSNWSTDIAVVDVYPGNMPKGQFHVTIANHGPGTLNKVKVKLLCGYDSLDKNTSKMAQGDQREFSVKLSMTPGEQQSFPTKLDLDTTVFEYSVGCQVFPGFDDPDSGNDSFYTTVN